jgi:hypothetical protein
MDDAKIEIVAAAMWPVIGSDYTWFEAVDRATGGVADDDFSQKVHQDATAYARDLARAAIAAMEGSK